MPTNLELAYIAGIIDGEGSISLIRAYQKQRPVRRRNSRSYGNPTPGVRQRTLLAVHVGMTDKQIPEWLHSMFGGSLYYRDNLNENWKGRHDWRLASQKAAKFLELVLPYLRVKSRQAKIAIRFQKYRVPHITLSGDQREMDGMMYDIMRSLNQRGATQTPLTL